MRYLPILFISLSVQIISYAQISNEYEVYAIRFAIEKKHIPLSFAAVGATDKDSTQFCDMFWLLKGAGKLILVDAGYTLNDFNKEWSDIYSRPDSALLRMGIKASDITDIIITHPHDDHIAGIELFPTAQLWMQKDDYDYFVGAAWQKNGFNKGFFKEDVRKLVDRNLEGKLALIKGDSIELFPGIRVFIGSKHTWESQYLLVNGKTGKVIIASDNCWFYYNIEHLLPISKYVFDSNSYVTQLKRMRALQPNISFIIPGHDLLVFSRFPKVAEGIVKIR